MSLSSQREGSEPPPGERKRVTLACQVCKKRKIRCDGNPEKCENCKGFGTECVYLDSGVKRGPQKGYKSKRKRPEGEDRDRRETFSFGSGPNFESRSPPTRDTQERGPGPTGGSGWNERPRDPERSDSESSSPPLRETCWSAMRTDLSRERTVAGLPRRAEVDMRPTSRNHQDPPAGEKESGVAASPDIGMAISALESLSEERNYQPRLPAPPRDPDNTNHDPAFVAPDTSPHRQTLIPPAGASRNMIPSVPASSRNSDDGMDTRCHDPNGFGKGVPGVRIDRQTQDRLLAIYWTHIHNVWPLLYKPEFYPSTVHRPLLLAMLAAASAIPTPGKTILNATQADQLFTQAQDAVLRRTRSSASTDQFDEIAPAKSSLQTVQCLILFSLRQTSGGNKSSAYLWYCHAAAMALELGLHRVMLDKSKQSQAEIESRCRVFWTCYVLDKSFSEEMGRPVLLRASTTTTPLPSTHEADEYELWPPPSVSLGQKSRSRAQGDQRHIQPTKSRTITCFNATVRLAHIVEQCLDLDNELLVSSMSAPKCASRQLFVMDNAMIQEEISKVEKQKEHLAQRLTDWWNDLDPDLRVDSHAKICPPIHFVVNCCWYYSAAIFLHSKNIGPKPPASTQSERYQTSHRICSEAAGNIVALLGCLDNFKILAPASSDIIHMLSHAALFHAYNAAIPNNEYAASAQVNFQQCCLWLQEIGSFWAPASVQRQFFEGLVKGGKELTAMHRNTQSQRTEMLSTVPAMSVVSPTQLLQQPPSHSTPSIQQTALAPLVPSPEGSQKNLASNTANMLNVPDSGDISRVRSHFWNEFLPNTEQFNADNRRESDFGAMATNLSEDLGSLYDLSILSHSDASQYPGGQTVTNGDDTGLAAFANLTQAAVYPGSGSTNTASSVEASNNIDPSDWLVAYMLDSIQTTKS